MSNVPPLFVRHQLGDTPGHPSQGGWSACPDIIFAQNNALDPATLVTTANYNTQPSNKVNVSTSIPLPNNVYLRALATAAMPNPRLWFYFTQGSLALWPDNWRADSIQYQGKNQNYADLAAVTANQIFVTPSPMVWNAPPVPPGDHYCGVLFATDSTVTNPKPSGFMGSLNDLIAFILAHPQMGWANTNDVPIQGKVAKTLTVPYTSPAKGGQFYIGAQTTNLPTDGTFDFILPGPPGEKSVSLQKLQIPYDGYLFMIPVTWKASSFATSVTITYYPGNTALPAGADIQAVLGNPKGSVLATHGHLEHVARFAEMRNVSANAMIVDPFSGALNSDFEEFWFAGAFKWNLIQQ